MEEISNKFLKGYQTFRQKYADVGMSHDFREYFVNFVKLLCNERAEHEARPFWVTDIEDYRMKSEIVCFVLLLGSIEPSEEPTEEENAQITQFYEDIKEYGGNNGWDLSILHLQFLRCMGTSLHSSLKTMVCLRKLDPIDYN